MPIAYFDCFAGAAGDMIVAALLDAGASLDDVTAQLARLGMTGCAVGSQKVRRGGLAAVKFNVEYPRPGHEHRHLSEILSMIGRAQLADRAADRARRIFTRLAEAEAKVHLCPVEEVHFHEIGAVDSITDIVGACVALELLDVERVLCSALPVGSGTVSCEHGVLPVPTPATAELLKGVKTAAGELTGELLTPTAAAVLTTLAEAYGPMPAMEVLAVGYGAGSREGDKMPNLLRVFIGQAAPVGTADAVVELSANIDDCTGEVLGAAIEKLLLAGCVDAWASPAVMKKSRPAWLLGALCSPGDVDAVEKLIFAETTTFGIRRRLCERTKLQRTFQPVETPYGPILMKIGRRGPEVVTAQPEFDECLAAAQAHHVTVREVLAAAVEAYRREKGHG